MRVLLRRLRFVESFEDLSGKLQKSQLCEVSFGADVAPDLSVHNLIRIQDWTAASWSAGDHARIRRRYPRGNASCLGKFGEANSQKRREAADSHEHRIHLTSYHIRLIRSSDVLRRKVFAEINLHQKEMRVRIPIQVAMCPMPLIVDLSGGRKRVVCA